MSDDITNGRATIREVRDLLQALDDKIDNRFERLTQELEVKYVLRAACRERAHASMQDITEVTDLRYASKTTERLVNGLVATVLLAVLYAVLHLLGI